MSSKISTYRGVEISAEDLGRGKFAVVTYEANLRYSWSSGVAIGRFLLGLKNGELLGRKCDSCRRILLPPRMYCEVCFRATDRWVKLRDTGRIATYSVSYVNADASRRKEPIIVAVVEIDDARPAMGILHLLGEVDAERVFIGMRVRAAWKAPEERMGAITDIRYFKPLSEGDD